MKKVTVRGHTRKENRPVTSSMCIQRPYLINGGRNVTKRHATKAHPRPYANMEPVAFHGSDFGFVSASKLLARRALLCFGLGVEASSSSMAFTSRRAPPSDPTPHFASTASCAASSWLSSASKTRSAPLTPFCTAAARAAASASTRDDLLLASSSAPVDDPLSTRAPSHAATSCGDHSCMFLPGAGRVAPAGATATSMAAIGVMSAVSVAGAVASFALA